MLNPPEACHMRQFNDVAGGICLFVGGYGHDHPVAGAIAPWGVVGAAVLVRSCPPGNHQSENSSTASRSPFIVYALANLWHFQCSCGKLDDC